MGHADKAGEVMKEKIQIILFVPVALLLAVLTYIDWYVFGNFPERKF